ncbi:Lrp/AsnC family transcriptional regulator [Pseudogemmatithrix spongiicola]|uniref:Lrp/AsnC family transcriptional regulator n=1 Tax=Pseudogemmatithrix spongiicola TaxID=3062599 RepID=A0AA49JWG2_9BACT|nr:Lrp/AsnC family transcriptional regulator [Gemmatimonadaceae bacterium 'strain 138']WKW16198.1 Lrp/AsnC family transcriptional regulator [Gemmatimonadaceae bacterium 'strain 318']
MRQLPQKILSEGLIATLDRTDRLILAHLQHNARLSNKELAAKVGLSPSSCLARVRRLEQGGVLRGYHADVALGAFGVTLQAMVAVRLEKHVRAAITAFERHLATLPEVLAWHHVAGANDYLVHVAVHDAAHLREFVLTAFAGRTEVAHLETNLIFSHRRSVAFGAVEPRRAERQTDA